MADNPSYLFAGEEIALTVRPHPIVLAKPAIAPLAAIALFAGFPHQVTFWILMVLLVRFGWDAALWSVDRYVLTTDRILSITGIFNKKVVSMPLAKITDLTYEKPIVGRIFGYGSLDLESAGQQGLERIDYLPDPDHFYRSVMSLALGERDPLDARLHNDGA